MIEVLYIRLLVMLFFQFFKISNIYQIIDLSFFFFDKARVQRHKKGIENSPKYGMSYILQSMSEVLIYIIKKRKK